MKQIYPMTVLVLVAITICCSAIGVRPAAKKPKVHVAISQTNHPATMVASGE